MRLLDSGQINFKRNNYGKLMITKGRDTYANIYATSK